MSTGRTVEGAGCITWWGFGPARDLLNAGTLRPAGEVNVLLLGAADPKHILKTIAGLKETDTLHVVSFFFSCMLKKTEVFLELFGNSEIRCQTEETLKHVAAQLSLAVTDTLDAHTQEHPCFNTSLLKFKERDELARLFKQWQHPPSSPASVFKAWDARVRQHLGTRYDSRKGCFDWDLTMKLHPKGCEVINRQQYIKWRERGVAFEMREGLYQTTNQSLISTRVFNHRGDRMAVRGYWGDVVSSPYLSFGIETENKDLLKTQNKHYVKTAQDISIVNVQMLFESLSARGGHRGDSQNGSNSHATETQPQPGASTNDETEQHPQNQNSAENQTTKKETQLMSLGGVSVSFLSPDSLSKLPVKSRYSHLFNVIYCSASMVHQLDSSLKGIAAPDALLIVELAKYLLDLSKEQEAAFAVKVEQIAKEAGFIPICNQSGDAYAVFTLQKS
uniref:Dynein axonemal assembly factor 3 n=1 Tax=Astyanax mexicanus TaxID=7994 RepID=W5KXR8_ASTMX